MLMKRIFGNKTGTAVREYNNILSYVLYVL